MEKGVVLPTNVDFKLVTKVGKRLFFDLKVRYLCMEHNMVPANKKASGKMIEMIENIMPNELNDLSELRKLVRDLINVVESQAKRIDELTEENQALRNEINRLKGEHGALPEKPNKSKKEDKIERERKKKGVKGNHKNKGPKKPRIKIDRTVKCEVDKSELPPDAKFKGYRTVIQQDIIIKRNNTKYEVARYYSAKEKRYYNGNLPEDYAGEFGIQLKSWIQMLHHYADVTQGRMKALLENLGILISKGTISNIILSNTEMMEEEAREILRAGIETMPFAQMDGTKSFEAGKGKSTQIISSPSYSIYYTMDSKSKTDILWALQGKRGSGPPLCYNELAVAYLKNTKVAKKDRVLLGRILDHDRVYAQDEFESLLSANGAGHLMQKDSYRKMTAGLALGHYLSQKDYPTLSVLVSDAGPEYTGIAPYQSLCWLHEERHYKKMVAKLKVNRQLIEGVRRQIWDFYAKLLDFKKLPIDQQNQRKNELIKDFDTIFTQKTSYNDLNDRIDKTFGKKEKLLRVLDFPDTPLHNNNAELAVRRKVRKRDISIHTMSPKGTRAQDAFMSVVETAAKLGVNALDYLYDRISNNRNMQPLAELVRLYTL